jgi:hypothetical protein
MNEPFVLLAARKHLVSSFRKVLEIVSWISTGVSFMQLRVKFSWMNFTHELRTRLWWINIIHYYKWKLVVGVGIFLRGNFFFPVVNFVFEAVEKTERNDVFEVFLCHFFNIWGKTHQKFRWIPFFKIYNLERLWQLTLDLGVGCACQWCYNRQLIKKMLDLSEYKKIIYW